MFRTLRYAISSSRLPIRTEAFLSQTSTSPTLQRVRFTRQPFWSTLTAVKLGLYGGTLFFIGDFLIPRLANGQESPTSHSLFTSQADTETSKKSPKERSPTDSVPLNDLLNEHPIWVPLGLTKECRPKPYRGSDPEWQEFLKFSWDDQKMMMVRHELADMCARAVQRNPRVLKRVGEPAEIQQWWLDYQFPTWPPPEYERHGLEITGESIHWSTRPVTARNHRRLRQAFWPRSLSLSFWASYRTLMTNHLTWLKGALGLEDSQKDTMKSKDRKVVAGVQRTRHGLVEEHKNSGATSRAPQTSQTTSKPDSTKSARTTSISTHSATKLPLFRGPPPTIDDSKMSAKRAFLSTLFRTWRPATAPPPRGSLLLSGLVKIVGTEGAVTLDVYGAYNPKDSRWEGVSVNVRRLVPHSQAPRGGD